MIDFYLCDDLGKIVSTGTCQDSDYELQEKVGLNLKVGAAVYGEEYFDGVSVVKFPVKPSEFSTFDYSLGAWKDARALEEVKSVKNICINADRLASNLSTFPFAGKLIAADQLSRSDIDAVHGIVVLTNAMPDNWVGGWKTVDNSYVSIPDVTTWTSFYKAMVGQGSVNFAHAQSLKTRLAAAKTIEEVDAIVW